MAAHALIGSTAPGESISEDEATAPSAMSNHPARIDFAYLSERSLLVYGWVLGFLKDILGAELEIGTAVINLTTQAKSMRRPDVAHHFSLAADEDECGFLVMAELRGPVEFEAGLRLRLTSRAGEIQQSLWPIEYLDSPSSAIDQTHLATLKTLLRGLPEANARFVAGLIARAEKSVLVMDLSSALPHPLRFEVDLCCVIEKQMLLVYGWMHDPAHEMTSLRVNLRGEDLDFFSSAVFFPRRDVDANRQSLRRPKWPQGFLFLHSVPEGSSTTADACFSITTHSGETIDLSWPVSWKNGEARRDLFEILARMNEEAALRVISHFGSVMEGRATLAPLVELLESEHDAAVERLPLSIESLSEGSVFLAHLDQVIPVSDAGIFLNGWLYAAEAESVEVVCQCGRASFPLGALRVSYSRKDVTAYLATKGIHAEDDEHGFFCYVPLSCSDHPHRLSIKSRHETERTMRIAPAKVQTALATIREILSAIQCEQSQFLPLMERHVGPAVQAVWASRKRPKGRRWVESFGESRKDAEVSILVPLFGRWDFIEYQMALFASDADLKRAQLIYVVDDPSIFSACSQACPDLYGIYQVPFTMAYSGQNLGFAGANNFGAQEATGKYLLLLNSDVLPRRPGWVSALADTYRSLEPMGVLGAKLLYEDGTIQHAGMAFRRHAAWGGMWINDHPLKGQNIAGLSGAQEADAVTAACAMIETELFRKLGGFSEDYIIGDFEDSDLCLRAQAAGRRNYIDFDVDLYHLERQSQNRIGSSFWRSNLTAYNCWVHNRRWASLIEAGFTEPKAAAAAE